MKRFSHLIALFLLLLFHSTVSFGQAWSGILAPARATDWSYAGIPGGIPSATWAICATSACNTVSGGTVTTASISAAIASAPNQTVVQIPAGNFTANIVGNRSNVVVRGAGPRQTKITGTVFFSQNGSGGQGSVPSTPYGSTNWTGGLTQGSTVLTLASTAGISAGQNILLDQLNAAWVYTNGVELGVSGSLPAGNSAGRNDSPLGFGGSANRAELEFVHVVSVDSSTQITIAAPGVSFTHSGTLAPQAFFWSSGSGNIRADGIENISVNVNSQNFGVSFPFCDYCWVKNVAVTNTARAGVYFLFGYRDEIRDSYLQGSDGPLGPTDYGVEINDSTFSKVENNIFFGITSNVLMEGGYGTVISYNYTLDTASGAQITSIDTHLAHSDLQLWEGNVTSGEAYDNSWGSASHMTAFRNYASGVSPNKTNYRIPFQINAHNHYMNLVGNVLGDPTFHKRYQCDQANSSSADDHVFDLGFWNSCSAGINSSNPYDAVTESSLARWGNWDAVTYNASGSSHLGTRWCTGSGTGGVGADPYNTACTASETASSDPTFPGLASPSTTLPASFYLATKPSWWGAVAWPPIGPDVTGGNIANTGGHANQIPAQLCYNNTAKANGFLTAFDANACYANSISTAPSPPTGLTVVVQ